MPMEQLSLKELLDRVRKGVEESVPGRLWIRAEVSEIKVNYSGHCYMTLVEKGDENVVARAQAVIWSSSYRLMAPYFKSVTGSDIQPGMSILAKVQVQYTPLYGMNLIISDMDPSFTIGEVEAARRRTLERLEKEGMLELNKSLRLAAVPKRFAVISSETAAGYRDFIRHLHENEYGFSFVMDLYPSVMQGAEAPGSIISSLEKIAGSGTAYDAVLILRGGGAVSDMVCFDDYELALNIAQFPVPVFTAVGHDKDFHVCDAVSFEYMKTPTAMADFFISMFASLDGELVSLASRLVMSAREIYAEERIMLEKLHVSLKKLFGLSVKEYFFGRKSMLENISVKLRQTVDMYFRERRNELEIIGLRLCACDPGRMLDKGYALVSISGKRIDSVRDAEAGDTAEILLRDGVLKCKVIEKCTEKQN